MSGHRPDPPRGRLIATVIAAAVALVSASCGTASEGSAPIRTGEPPTDRIPVIVDTDLDLGDIAALAVLLRDPAVDVRAITIVGTGAVGCGTGRLVTRYLLDELGVPTIPFGCGPTAGGPDAHPLPEARRARADAAFGLDIPPQAEPGVPMDAVQAMTTAIEGSPSAPTIITLGPLTNLETAFAADETLADRVAAVHAMLGTIDGPGDVLVDGHDADDPLEWNAYADPSAVAAVLASAVPVSLVPLDAADDVPVSPDLADALEADRRAAGADLVYELLVRNPERLRLEDGQRLASELTALALTDPDLVAWADESMSVGADGRLVRDESGHTLRYAASADRAAVESALREALGRGGPRATPFVLAGSLTVAFDGATCSLSGASDETGLHELRYQGPPGAASGAAVVTADGAAAWADLTASLPSLTGEPPQEWLLDGPSATDPAGTGAPVSTAGPLEGELAGAVCYIGSGEAVRYVAGRSFPVGGGVIPPP